MKEGGTIVKDFYPRFEVNTTILTRPGYAQVVMVMIHPEPADDGPTRPIITMKEVPIDSVPVVGTTWRLVPEGGAS